MLALIGGIAAAIFGEDATATALFYFQIAIYFVSLFALLAGMGSAQAEREEWQLLFTQPLPRVGLCRWKILRFAVMFAGVLLLCSARAFGGTTIRALASLYLKLLLAATFLACGLAAGYFAHDRAQGLLSV